MGTSDNSQKAIKGTYSLLSIVFGGMIALLLLQTFFFAYDLFTPKSFIPAFWGLNVSLSPQEFDLLEKGLAKYSIVGMEGSLVIYDPGFWIALLSHIIPFIIIGSLSTVVYLLRKMIRTIYDGQPFIVENGKRMRKIALLIILVPLSVIIIRLIISLSLPDDLVINGMNVTMPIARVQHWVLIMVGLVILVVSEVFRIGVELNKLVKEQS